MPDVVMTFELISVRADELIAVVGRTMLTAGVGHLVDGLRAVDVACLDALLA